MATAPGSEAKTTAPGSEAMATAPGSEAMATAPGSEAMATAPGSEATEFLGSPFGSRLEKDGYFISKVFDKINDSHPHLVSGLSEELTNKSPVRILLSTQEVKDLTNIKNKQQLKHALQIAVELEMTVMFEYLFACFSIINNSDEVNSSIGKGLNSYNSELRREYKTQLMIICIQEMQHMSMAIDMLISIGGIPNLQKVKFPSTIGIDEENADLIRLNLQSLYMFAKNEEPYPTSMGAKMFSMPGKHSKFEYYSIAQLYDAISKGFTHVWRKHGNSMFELNKHMTNMTQRYTSLEKVQTDITLIETQGEGELGGKLFKDIIILTRDWVKSQKVTGDDNIQLQKEIIELCDQILSELDNLEQLLPHIGLLIALLSQFESSTGLPFPIGKDEFLNLKTIDEPSHWARFLMMIMNYSMLNESTDSKSDNYASVVSRPSHPRPGEGFTYYPTTQKLVDLANASYQILLMILEGTIIAVPEVDDKAYQITARYNSIRFYPIMSILIFPLGEALSYFRLSEEEPNKTAGFPFQTAPKPHVGKDIPTHPVEKFLTVVSALKKLHEDSVFFKKECYKDFDNSVGMWITDDPETRKTIVNRVIYTLDHVIRSIEVLYQGFSNGIPLQPPKKKKEMKKQTQTMKECKDKFYLNIEFDGYAIYSMATDFDPTYETRGFIGHQFMFEYSNDPNFTDEFYTKNTLKNCYTPFKRDYIPDRNYKGVKITSAKLVPPCYMTETELSDTNFLEVQKAIEEEFFGKSDKPEITDFRFYSMKIHNVEYTTKFQQLNTALSRQMGIDPINVGFETNSFKVKRANLLYDDDNKVVDYDTACTKCSDTFGVYSVITDPRTAKSGGYLQWDSTFNTINGLLMNTNLMNSKCGAGQSIDDFYTAYKLRADAIMKDIKEILDVPRYKADSLANLIIPFLEYYPAAKLISLALMINIDPEVRNILAYLCTRYLNITYLIGQQFKNSPFQCFYHIPLNAPLETNKEIYSVVENTSDNENLSRIKFLIDQDWYVDFWVGGYDYDALTFFMSGSLMIPVHVKPKS